jgi:molybdenum cofactor guanylyltransferase
LEFKDLESEARKQGKKHDLRSRASGGERDTNLAEGKVEGFILAGGESSRMGRDKALLELDGAPLIVRAARLVESVVGAPTVVGYREEFRALGLRAIADDAPGAGPLGGIATALRAARMPWSLIIACDLPYLSQAWLEFLTGRAMASKADVVIPMNERGAEPLCAVYNKRAEAGIREALARGTRKITDALASARIETIEPREWKAFDSEGVLFKNMNSPGDYEESKAKLGGPTRK